MLVVIGIFAATCMTAGFHYLLQSQTALRLAVFEGEAASRRRHRFRQAGAATMMGLAVFLVWGAIEIEPDSPSPRALVPWAAASVLVLALLVLALFDLTLTARLRRRKLPPR